jgi:uracil-DNA glycosylase
MDGKRDTFGFLARDLAARISWDAELGAHGYSAGEKAAPIAAVPTSPRAQVEKAPSPDDPATGLAMLRAELGDCRRCKLCEGRTNIVFGDGDPQAALAFVGEGPGHDEDLSGLPFVGAAGQLLTKIIAAIGLERKDVYICNIVKCRPPKNRDPEPDETAACGPFALRQLEIIRPRVIVALGRPAARFLLGTDEPISALRGSFLETRGALVMPTFHPAYLLRNESAKRPVWEDMKKVRDALGPGEARRG